VLPAAVKYRDIPLMSDCISVEDMHIVNTECFYRKSYANYCRKMSLPVISIIPKTVLIGLLATKRRCISQLFPVLNHVVAVLCDRLLLLSLLVEWFVLTLINENYLKNTKSYYVSELKDRKSCMHEILFLLSIRTKRLVKAICRIMES